MVTIQSQNFGVEIEMTGVSRGTAASVIANYFGVGGIHFAGGTYQTYEAKDSKGRVWKCMRDGSITPRRRIGGAIVEADDTYRCEVVTPILQYEDITDLQEVIRALVKKGAMANSSCGIHVHVDGANHTPESLCRLLNFATGRQDLFYEALQIGSRADHWCHKINPTLFREMKKNGRASRNDAERIWYSVANDGYDGGVDSSHYDCFILGAIDGIAPLVADGAHRRVRVASLRISPRIQHPAPPGVSGQSSGLRRPVRRCCPARRTRLQRQQSKRTAPPGAGLLPALR